MKNKHFVIIIAIITFSFGCQKRYKVDSMVGGGVTIDVSKYVNLYKYEPIYCGENLERICCLVNPMPSELSKEKKLIVDSLLIPVAGYDLKDYNISYTYTYFIDSPEPIDVYKILLDSKKFFIRVTNGGIMPPLDSKGWISISNRSW